MPEPATRQRTPSTQTNRLIDLCEAVLAGEKGKLNDLNLYLQERIMALDQARASFLEGVAGEGEEFATAFHESIDAVLQSFEQCAEAQGTIAQFLVDRQTIHLERGIDALVTATTNMFLAITHYESRYAQTGPTTFPIVNFYLKAVAALKDGTMSAEDFRTSVEGARQFFAKSLEEIDASDRKNDKGVPERRDACARIVSVFERMEQSISEPDLLDGQIPLLEEGFGKLEASLKLYQQGAFTDGPTESPYVNWVIHACEGVKSGLYPPTLLKEALDYLERNLRESRSAFEGAASVPVASAVLQDEIPHTLEAFDLHEEAIAGLRASLPTPTGEQLDAGIAALTNAVSNLKKSVDTYQNVADREGKVLCPRCSAPNLPEQKVCNKCGGPMPKVADPSLYAGASSTFEVRETDEPRPDESGEELVMTTHLKRLFDACEALDQSQISHEDFLSVVDWAENLLDQAESQMDAIGRPGIPADLDEEEEESLQEQLNLVDETSDLLVQGIAEFRSGLDLMRSYLDHQNRDRLALGVRTVWEGAQKIYQVQRMGVAVEKFAAEREQQAASEVEESTEEPEDRHAG